MNEHPAATMQEKAGGKDNLVLDEEGFWQRWEESRKGSKEVSAEEGTSEPDPLENLNGWQDQKSEKDYKTQHGLHRTREEKKEEKTGRK